MRAALEALQLAKGWLGLVCGRKGMHSEAVAECTQAVELSGALPLMEAALGCVQALSGDREEALKTLGRLRELSRQRYVMPYVFALIHASLGQQEQALDWLEKAYDERGNLLCYLSVDPAFDDLRSHPRLKDLLRRVGFPS